MKKLVTSVVFIVIIAGVIMARVGEMEIVNGVIYIFSATDSSIVAQINGLP